MGIIRQIGPHWFTTVMGIGIVAALTFTSPIAIPFQHVIGTLLFFLLNVVFAAAMGSWILRWMFHTRESLNDFRHPSSALFYGAFAMGINVVGNDYLLIGTQIFHAAPALLVSKVLWVAGTVASIFTVVVVPYLLFAEHEVEPQQTLATWLIPVVPPIVAAATGMNLIPFWQGHAVQFAMLALLLAMFGVTFFLFMMVSGLVYSRLVYHKRLSGEAAPSLWVEIGPIGMSMAVFGSLSTKTTSIFAPYTHLLHALGLIFDMALWGVGVWWIVISSMHTILHVTKRGDGLPFHMGWWSYVFPIGSFTNGTYALAHLTSYPVFFVAGLVQLLMLWGCFVVVFARTAHGIYKGDLLQWRVHRRRRGMAAVH
ncbi:C4-dicarboxylate ABC transporter [Alicyclobacillus cycloheptanicus]|uniref:C4-dicarboxylate transporter/malic acid transport protein n=1 Tax=Alicyclobacillus cycloheptanicus TaxID=1457 RepID=A0ABT9XKR0_9BACL|nr:C4-dicarboxylate ABC transporter [Alicyclobacillus cycloheptanicus]MDQ0190873.1 C4-dicarboxylate transporter/malic acid transport protein [Alicyclobacillus cycloheptanicus]WDM01762.1 C4-dicarboxylate ABC transporter [Alicyclobacillus cycloheptanicus]